MPVDLYTEVCAYAVRSWNFDKFCAHAVFFHLKWFILKIEFLYSKDWKKVVKERQLWHNRFVFNNE